MTTTPSARAREAAADLTRRHYPHEKGMIRLADTIASGHADSTLFAQAFARFEAEIRADEQARHCHRHQGTQAMTIEDQSRVDIAEMRALMEACTKGDLSTAERHIESEYVECPACSGDGEIEASDYCNFDGKALGVQFYGIGPEFGAHEKLWRAVTAALPALLTELEATRAAAERIAELEGALERFASGPCICGEIYRASGLKTCATCRARAALQRKEPGA